MRWDLSKSMINIAARNPSVFFLFLVFSKKLSLGTPFYSGSYHNRHFFFLPDSSPTKKHILAGVQDLQMILLTSEFVQNPSFFKFLLSFVSSSTDTKCPYPSNSFLNMPLPLRRGSPKSLLTFHKHYCLSKKHSCD